MNAPCVGRHELFDSVFVEDHKRAAALCRTCPAEIFAQCRERFEETAREWGYDMQLGPRGTWAGRLSAPGTDKHTATEIRIVGVNTGATNRERRGATHCQRGHAFDQDNTYIDTRGYRTCRTCVRENRHKREAAKKNNQPTASRNNAA